MYTFIYKNNNTILQYDPKITTPPALYWLSALFLLPFKACSTYWLRFVNYMLGIVNIELTRRLLAYNNQPTNLTKFQSRVFEIYDALVICFLPPMYFFSNLYYTDTLSITSVLGIFLAAKSKHYLTMILLGKIHV